MSKEQRNVLLEIASEHDLLIVEDAAYNFMRYKGKATPLKVMDRDAG